MNHQRSRKSLVAVMLTLATGLAAAEDIGLDDFAWHAAITTTTDDSPLHELRLPLEVHRAATHPGLGDLRVFNAAGDVVPHGLLPAPLDTPQASPRLVPVAAFPFAELAARRPGELDVRVHQEADRTSVTVRGGGSGVLQGSWVVDTGSLESAPRALLLRWPERSAPLTRSVQIEGSHDLSRWYRLERAVTIADVSWAGERLLANRLELPAARYRWYRIEAVDGGGPLPPLEVEAELPASGETDTPREWLAVAMQPLDEPPGALTFESPPALPVDRVRITPAERNSYLRLRVQARTGDDAEWRTVGRGSAYRLEFDNGALSGLPLAVRAPAAHAWRLVPEEADADARGSGFGRLPPEVAVGWTPRSLVFLARGEGPFVLAFGSRRVEPLLNDGRRLLGDSVDIVSLPQAGIGAALPGADPARALAATLEVPWRQIMLWAVLVAGAGLLGLLAWRALRQSGQQSE